MKQFKKLVKGVQADLVIMQFLLEQERNSRRILRKQRRINRQRRKQHRAKKGNYDILLT